MALVAPQQTQDHEITPARHVVPSVSGNEQADSPLGQPTFAGAEEEPEDSLSSQNMERLDRDDNKLLEAARAVNLLLELVVHSFMAGEDGPYNTLQVPHQASVSYVKREICRKTQIAPNMIELKAVASKHPARRVLRLQDMPEYDENNQEYRIQTFGLKPPGPGHLWCWVHNPAEPLLEPPQEVPLTALDRGHAGPASPTAAARQPREPLQQQTPPAAGRRPQESPQQLNSPGSAAGSPAWRARALQLPAAEQAEQAEPQAKRARLVESPVPAGGRRKAGRWTADDIEYLIQGVEKYQLSNWSLIRKTGLDGIFTGRTDVDLKDKWRNLTQAVKRDVPQRGVRLTDDQRERIIKCLPEYNYVNDEPDDEHADGIESPA